MGKRLRQQTKFKTGKLSFGTEPDPMFPNLAFSLPSPVIQFYGRQILLDANALIIPKPFVAPPSYRQSLKAEHLEGAALGCVKQEGISSGVYAWDPWKSLTSTCDTPNQIKENQQTTVNNQFIQAFADLLNHMDYSYGSTAFQHTALSDHAVECVLAPSDPQNQAQLTQPQNQVLCYQ